MAAAGEFAEWAVVHGNKYGTSRPVVEHALTEGQDVVFDVDWQGGRELKQQWPDDALMIFILPPNLQILEQRLRKRATDSEEVITRRLKTAIEEIGHHDLYPYKIINDDLDDSYALLRAMYLCRKYGAAADPALAERVDANLAADIGKADGKGLQVARTGFIQQRHQQAGIDSAGEQHTHIDGRQVTPFNRAAQAIQYPILPLIEGQVALVVMGAVRQCPPTFELLIALSVNTHPVPRRQFGHPIEQRQRRRHYRVEGQVMVQCRWIQ